MNKAIIYWGIGALMIVHSIFKPHVTIMYMVSLLILSIVLTMLGIEDI